MAESTRGGVTEEARRMRSYHFDVSRWPLVVVSYTGSMTEDEVDGYSEVMLKLLASGDRQAYVYDASGASTMSPAVRKRQGQLLRTHRATIHEKVAGAAFVFPSAMHRFILSSVFLIQPYPAPYVVCATREEAVAWALGRLKPR